ncbi:MAG: KOW domain-containing RNA-binding protein [Eubacteriales bacterium]|jgi:ribosomal protein L14E/L6E/L27E|nr:KOW domain-containing RNA-binding protein [Eubacteriales bacterium]MDD3571762.1 KOW domain-containing RNA-binding protein [Eubacteriales bacterium]MDD4134318.1 KOW domain-containing RNA-binding protein [Eubacteriales bacterium]NLO13823.1 RNA-binding protein [Clostridiales bacterium]
MKPQIKPGLVVISRMGRDKDKRFVVLWEVDADFVMVADGHNRGISRPKRKRRKHLLATRYEFPEIIALKEQGRLTDYDLRNALGRLQDTPQDQA